MTVASAAADTVDSSTTDATHDPSADAIPGTSAARVPRGSTIQSALDSGATLIPDIARAVRIADSHARRILVEGRAPSWRIALALSDAMHVSLDALWSHIESKRNRNATGQPASGARADAARMAQLYAAGATMTEIGEQYGVTRQRVSQLVGAARPTSLKSAAEVAREAGVTLDALRRWIDEAGK